ncbi:solute carrier organic anion transporter family member 1B3 [Xenopus tropicalis]|eukprot:NP_001027493.1 solute carrier organic anion transporter family member 1B3 [Xenopus tropicalis]
MDPPEVLMSNGGGETPPQKVSCCSNLKMFLVALCFSYFAKAFSGSYMKSSITQIERRFDISSSTVGMIDGSFEIGNLMVIAIVSYFGAQFHRPRIIAAGCILMSLGSFLTAMPHFFMGLYKYETVGGPTSLNSNATINVSPCLANRSLVDTPKPDCVTENGSHMWVFLLVGNILRGIGETPIAPLGISYLDDFSRPENTPLHIACLHTVAMFGPMTGFMLGSFLARLYVDIGFVDTDTITITPQDTRWVGAWWIGFLLSGAVNLMSAIPFFFLPESLKEEQREGQKPQTKQGEEKGHKQKEKPTLRGFFAALKTLCFNRLFVMLMCLTLLQTNSFLGFITYKPKYMEQQYGQSISKANFVTGVSTLPAAALGMFLGGLIMKRYKFGLLGASKMAYGTSLLAFLLSLSAFFIGCENNNVAGITVTYDRVKVNNFQDRIIYSPCNSDCHCSSKQWDPVCGENGVTYVSACLAGCKASTGSGLGTVYHNCSCIDTALSTAVNSSAHLGSCPRGPDCSRMFMFYVVTQAINTFIFALGASSAYVLLLWSVNPEMKSLAVGVYMLLIRTLAGIPAPIYFGAIIDKSCLKWGTRLCGGRGACRLYDADSFRRRFLGLTAGIRAPSYILFFIFIVMVKRRPPTGTGAPQPHEKAENCDKKELYANGASADECVAFQAEKETHI